MKPIVSVVIPLYNKENEIQRAIQSVLAQTYSDFEVIVINDGSTDNSLEQAQQIRDPRIRIISQENQGVSSARNNGVAMAKFEWIAFLDADDEWYPEFLESLLSLKTQFPNADVLSSSYIILDRDGTSRLPRTSTLFSKNWRGIITNFIEILQMDSPFDSSSIIVNKHTFDKIGGFVKGVHFGEDVDIWIRLSLQSKIAYINKPLSIYHKESENRACLLFLHGKSLDVIYPVKTVTQYLQSGKIPESQRQSAIEFIANHNLPLAQTHLYYGNTKKAVELILSCKGTRKHLIKKYWLLFFALLPPILLKTLIKIKHNILNPLFRISYE